MEKLIELLNKWELEVGSSRLKWYIGNNPIGIYCKSNDYNFGWSSKIILISKEYGFIKRLIENEKVEWDNKDIAIKEGILGKSIDNYHSLLMALSIQDEPIEFLVSILK